jgi:hypothetical protein
MQNSQKGQNYNGEYFNEIQFIFSIFYNNNVFIGRKAIAVFFGEETVAVKTWKQVFTAILIRCNQERHENLMYLREKTSGKVRLFLADKPDGMRNPVKLDDELYTESGNYGAATMMHILRDRILAPAQFNYSGIRIAIR